MDSLFSILVKKGPGEEEAQQDKAIFPNAAENEERKQTDAKKINPDQSALARTPSSWSQDPLTEFISLSERKRQMMLLIPIKNKRIQEKFRKIVSKVQIYLKIQQVVNDIKVYGTSSHLHFQKSLVRDLKFMALEGLGFQNLHKEPQKDTLDPSQPSKLGVCEISDTKIRIWNWFIAVMLVFSMIYVPFTAAFLDYSIGFVVIETLISIIFFIDAIVYCKVAFLNPYKFKF